MSAPRSIRVPVAGGSVHALAWGARRVNAEGEAPTLVFLHATGMCAPVYGALLAPVAGRMSVLAIDARGHGATELAAEPGAVPHDWALYRADLAAVVRALDRGPVLLAGHSFGATVAAETAAEHPDLVEALLLLDPAFIPFAHAAAYRALRDSGGTPANPMADQAARRRARFATRAQARESWLGRGVFRGWPDAALDAYVAHGLKADGDCVALACTPAWEATSFRGVSTTLERSLHRLSMQFALLAGEAGSTVSPEDFATIAGLPTCRYAERLSGTGHFFPVTHPELVHPHLLSLDGSARGR